jgi:hypothetical protein
LLDLEEGITVIDEAETANDAVRKAHLLQPDVTLLDLRFRRLSRKTRKRGSSS